METTLTPIAEGLWTQTNPPHLIGGKSPQGKIVFPFPEGAAGQEYEAYPLSRTGTLWSWTRQEFKPKPPYDGPEEFQPFLLGYIKLAGEAIVQSWIVDAELEELSLNMPMEFVIIPFDDTRSTFAFKPVR
ncbi:MAG: OB-fold domain-containing protein [Henriciella sp.]